MATAAEEQPSISLSDCERDAGEADSDYCQAAADSDASITDLSDDDGGLSNGRWGRCASIGEPPNRCHARPAPPCNTHVSSRVQEAEAAAVQGAAARQ
jgi:hypothetical protein